MFWNWVEDQVENDKLFFTIKNKQTATKTTTKQTNTQTQTNKNQNHNIPDLVEFWKEFKKKSSNLTVPNSYIT